MNKETKQTILAYVLLVGIIMLMLMSCTKTIYVPGETKTEYIVQERVDSLIMHDSVYIKEVTKGDTVYIKEVRYRDRDHLVTFYDTLRSVDTIKVSVPVPEPYPVVEVDHKMNGFQKLFFSLGMIFFICVIIRLLCLFKPNWYEAIWEFIKKIFHI